MSTIVRFFERVTNVAAWIGGFMLAISAILVTAEVFLRKLFLVSLGGADEVSGYAFAIATSWGFAFALLHRAHVRIDVAYVRLPRQTRVWLDLIALLSLAVFVGVLTRHAAVVFLFAVEEGTHSNTPLRTPMWIPQGLWVSGLLFFCLVISTQVLRCVDALRRRDWAAVGRVAGTRSLQDEVDDEIDPALERRMR